MKSLLVLGICGIVALVVSRKERNGKRGAERMEPLKALSEKIDWKRLMGSWFVIGVIPTPFDKNCFNAVETYTQVKDSNRLNIQFKQQNGSFTAPVKTMAQEGKVVDTELGTEWKVRPTFAGGWIKPPFWLPYIIIEADTTDYAYFVVGYPNRKYLWIMSRDVNMHNYEEVVKRCADVYKYDVSRIWKVPHQQTE